MITRFSWFWTNVLDRTNETQAIATGRRSAFFQVRDTRGKQKNIAQGEHYYGS